MSRFEYLEQRWEKAPTICDNPDVKFPYKPGQKLPNGGIILAEHVLRQFDHRRDSLVLCVTFGYQPFVYWIRTIVTDSPLASGGFQIRDYCERGHYFSELDNAVDSYYLDVEMKEKALS